MTILDHAAAADLLDRLARIRSSFDGDAWVDCFSPDIAWQPSPFAVPLVGHNEMRALLLEASKREEQVEFTFERHWVVPPTILAPWHASHVDRTRRTRLRTAGFAAFEIEPGGRIRIARWWPVQSTTTIE